LKASLGFGVKVVAISTNKNHGMNGMNLPEDRSRDEIRDGTKLDAEEVLWHLTELSRSTVEETFN
jgi:hypothetical protein